MTGNSNQVSGTLPPEAIERQPNWRTMSTEERTSWFVSEMLSALTAEQDYEAAMKGVLEMMSMVIHTDRMSIFNCDGDNTTIAFEQCGEGVQSLLGVSFPITRAIMNHWFRIIGDKPVILVTEMARVEAYSKPLYDWFVENGINDFMAAPFYNNGMIVGFLGAYNARLDESVNLEKLFAAVSSFIGARIENHQLIRKLEWAGEHDALTGLYNRRGSQAAIEALHAEHPHDPWTLALFDLDDFKRINDLHGHDAGDRALKGLADALTAAFPAGSVICRNGGDEFFVAFSGDITQQADSLIERFAHTPLEYECSGERYPMTVSIGYANYPEHCKSLDELQSKADDALYTVKLSGKAGFAKYSAEDSTHYRARLGFSAHDIVENVPLSMLVVKADEEGSILYASTRFAHMLECDNTYDLMRLSGGTLAGIVDPGDRARVHASFVEHVNTCSADTSWAVDSRVVTKTGAIKPVHAVTLFVDIEGIGKVAYSNVEFIEECAR